MKNARTQGDMTIRRGQPGGRPEEEAAIVKGPQQQLTIPVLPLFYIHVIHQSCTSILYIQDGTRASPVIHAYIYMSVSRESERGSGVKKGVGARA